MEFLKLFGRLKSVVIGMVHVGALPGTPQSSLPLTQITDKACYESEIYKDAGVDGLIVENMHDLPYTVSVGPEITAAMAVISAAVKQTCPHLPLGIQILCSANQQAVAVALAAVPPCRCPGSKKEDNKWLWLAGVNRRGEAEEQEQ
ncbi:uncharacterized protein F13E9.13, mitochondrial isoform X1 [Pelodiscus sinensis]|uniref:uncharacterized protein F13E9.13, mitochondrial isoform X1 n=1 Tax=Pelodiscus sinensis TaxID=13735 RepID=UPI003F6BF8FF